MTQAPAAHSEPVAGPSGTSPTRQLIVGLDVGSTTVKAVLVDPATDEILWKDYRRHETRQAELCVEFLKRIEAHLSELPRWAFRLLVTGSGGAEIASHLGVGFVQEVPAISLAVDKLYPDVRSVIELGGQDAKIVVFKEDSKTGRKKKYPSMNDKCAGGTGSVIDKISARMNVTQEQLGSMRYTGIRLHPIAGKCGVFAETDANGLLKQGVPSDELIASLFESIVQQNLSVLTRGHTLLPHVLLLGGPNVFIPGLVECWRNNIPLMWRQRNVELPAGKAPEELIIVPDNAEYFAAIGAVEVLRRELAGSPLLGTYRGTEKLRWYIEEGRSRQKHSLGSVGLCRDRSERERFESRYQLPSWRPARFEPGSRVEAFIGLDGGSTSTKAVLLGRDTEVLAKAYKLSRGNPIEDAKEILGSLHEQILRQGCQLEVLGVGTTGYAKDILNEALQADVALVETVAHTHAGLHYAAGTDVIVDVGGQDIKLIFLKNGAVNDFKLNTQCSAGNGYFLQATAETLGFDVSQYADVAFSAQAMPEFGCGCAVFMQTDIVDFQRRGWQANEIMAGLAAVLPKNVWLYVAKISNLPQLGRKFILQGGTQRNLAAVKAQVDFIESRFAGTATTPEIVVHPHCGESGAIGCALEVLRRQAKLGAETRFIGMSAVQTLSYRASRGEETRCHFCKNRCLRTFIDVWTGEKEHAAEPIELATHEFKSGPEPPRPTRVKHSPSSPTASRDGQPPASPGEPLALRRPGHNRIIVATCEKGTVEDVGDMRKIKRELDAAKKDNPNLAEVWAREAFQPVTIELVADAPPRAHARRMAPGKRPGRSALVRRRQQLRIGMPRVLNMYSLAPFFSGYFQSLGVPASQIVWSDYTTDKLYRSGSRRGSIDPCFPSKLGIPHIHNLLHVKHTPQHPLTHIFFPMVDSLPPTLHETLGHRACPAVANTPEATHAAFVKEGDLFAASGIVFKKTFVNGDQPLLLARQLYLDWKDELGLSEEESRRAVAQGLAALEAFSRARRREAREILDRLEAEKRIGVVLLARPYHNDPGVNHGICSEFPKLGHPVLTQDCLPVDEDLLERLFGEELARGEIPDPLSIQDVWKNSYSENSSRKLWAAKFVARHPNLVALEQSSFKCGLDAPIYSAVQEIIERSGTPYFSFKDIDENRPTGSIKLRIETIAYFIERYGERFKTKAAQREAIDRRLLEFERRLRWLPQTADAQTRPPLP
ncbi:MAG: CoA activase [Acidobacteriota bacterium]|nr:MAG: CoA activase [Acidobacteriota bacterium]